MKLLYNRIAESLKGAALSHFSGVVSDPPLPLLCGLVMGAHRFQSTIVRRSNSFPPFTELAFVTGRRDIEEVLLRGDVFSVKEYLVRMTMTSGAFFLGMDEDRSGKIGPYEREQAAGAQGIGKKPGREHDFDESAYDLGGKAKTVEGIIKRASDETVAAARGREIDVVQGLGRKVPAALLEHYYGIPDIPGKPGELGRCFKTISDHVFNFFGGDPKYREPAALAGEKVRAHLLDVVRKGPNPDTLLGHLMKVLGEEDDVVRTAAGIASGTTVPTAGQFMHVVDRLLELPTDELHALRTACLNDDVETVLGYAREAARFYPYPPTIYRVARSEYVLGVGTVHEKRIPEGALVVPVFIGACFDRDYVTNPWKFDPKRPREQSMYFGFGAHQCMGAYIGERMLAHMTRALFELPGLKKVTTPGQGTDRYDSLRLSFGAN